MVAVLVYFPSSSSSLLLFFLSSVPQGLSVRDKEILSRQELKEDALVVAQYLTRKIDLFLSSFYSSIKVCSRVVK